MRSWRASCGHDHCHACCLIASSVAGHLGGLSLCVGHRGGKSSNPSHPQNEGLVAFQGMSLPVFISHHHGELLPSRAKVWKLPLDGTCPLRAGFIQVLAHPLLSFLLFPSLPDISPFPFSSSSFFHHFLLSQIQSALVSPALSVYDLRPHSCCGHRFHRGNTPFVRLTYVLKVLLLPSLYCPSFCHSWSHCYLSSLSALERYRYDFHTSSPFFHLIVLLPSFLATIRLLSCQLSLLSSSFLCASAHLLLGSQFDTITLDLQ